MVGVVGAQGQLTQGANLHNPRPKYKRSKNVFSVTSIALSLGRVGPQLLQPLAQSLIRSPGTLIGLWKLLFSMNIISSLRYKKKDPNSASLAVWIKNQKKKSASCVLTKQQPKKKRKSAEPGASLFLHTTCVRYKKNALLL